MSRSGKAVKEPDCCAACNATGVPLETVQVDGEAVVVCVAVQACKSRWPLQGSAA